MALLEVKNLSVAYGGVPAVRQLSFEVNAGEIVTILGANGAGKTSTMNSLMGVVAKSTTSEVTFDGARIERMPTEKIAQLGMTLTPEGRRVFPQLTVEENLRLGSVALKGRGNAHDLQNKFFDRFPILKKRRDQHAGLLSGGEQQQLAIARSLMSAPRLLLLDEPSLGLAPQIVEQIFELLEEIRADGVTILLVEQNVDQALAISDRGYVLSAGTCLLDGKASDLRTSSGIERAYLGLGTD